MTHINIAYYKDVDVYFQENMWTDKNISVKWVSKIFAPIVESLDQYILLCGNLTVQTAYLVTFIGEIVNGKLLFLCSDSFKSAVSA